MSNDIVFFNHFHNGDIHVSREIVKKIVNKVSQIAPGTKFSYGHSNPRNLLEDIPGLTFDSQAIPFLKDAHVNLLQDNGKLYINTWYAQQHYKYMNQYGLTMDCLYAALDDTCKQVWNFSLADISTDLSSFFPTIDYSKYEINSAKNWLANHPEKKIFVANGTALSGQAHNFNMMPIISSLAQQHPNKTFILSNNDGPLNYSNMVYSSSIINKSTPSDLNENSFLSSHCDIIIGRSSGASTFAMTQENLFQRKIQVLYFTNIVPVAPNKFWADSIFRDNINFSAEILNTNEADTNVIRQIIDSKLAMI